MSLICQSTKSIIATPKSKKKNNNNMQSYHLLNHIDLHLTIQKLMPIFQSAHHKELLLNEQYSDAVLISEALGFLSSYSPTIFEKKRNK